jgi:3-deoxy-D-manno-octulosonic-acid transferase
MENFREMSAKFLAAGAAVQVGNSAELAAAWRDLLRDRSGAERMGETARRLVDQNRGATDRVLDHLEGVLCPERSNA